MLRRVADRIFGGGIGRFLLPCVLTLGLKLLIAWIVYALATQGGGAFATFWMREWGVQPRPDWPFLFLGWDSAWYIRIAKIGYSYPAYAFLPAYPFLIRVVSELTGEFFASSFLASFVLGIVAVPMFQLLAEHYMRKDQAVLTTLLFSLCPPVFVFTSVAYTESLFTVAILGAWLLSLRRRWLPSVVFVTIAALTKVYGVLIALPLTIRLLGERKVWASVAALFAPVVALVGWNAYLYSLTGDWMACWSSQSRWQTGWPFGISGVLRFFVELNSGISHSGPVELQAVLVVVQWLLAIVLFGVLVVASIDVDRDFGGYAALLFLFVFSFGNVWSFLRFLPFILPVWLTVKVGSRFVAIVAILIFLMISLIMWYQFVVLGVWFG